MIRMKVERTSHTLELGGARRMTGSAGTVLDVVVVMRQSLKGGGFGRREAKYCPRSALRWTLLKPGGFLLFVPSFVYLLIHSACRTFTASRKSVEVRFRVCFRVISGSVFVCIWSSADLNPLSYFRGRFWSLWGICWDPLYISKKKNMEIIYKVYFSIFFAQWHFLLPSQG